LPAAAPAALDADPDEFEVDRPLVHGTLFAPRKSLLRMHGEISNSCRRAEFLP